MTVAAGILPALGFVILLRTIMDRDLLPYLIFGFVLSAYVGLPILGVTLVAVGIVLMMVFKERDPNSAVAASVEGDDDDF